MRESENPEFTSRNICLYWKINILAAACAIFLCVNANETLLKADSNQVSL